MAEQDLQNQINELVKDLEIFKRHDHFVAGGERLRTDLLGIDDADVAMSDVTTGDVSSTKHGFAPKSPADATKFLNGAATPAYALVKDTDLSLSDTATNNVSTANHGFCTKLSGTNTDYFAGDGVFRALTGLSLTKGTIANNTDVATSTGAGTNTDTVVTHGLGKTPVKVTISAAILAKGSTNASSYGEAIAVFDTSSSNPILISGRWVNSVHPSGTLVSGSIVSFAASSGFAVSTSGTDGENITIQVVSIGATQFTFRINGVLHGTDQGASTVNGISWICEG